MDLSYYTLLMTYSKDQLGCKNSVSPNILALLLIFLTIEVFQDIDIL